MPGALTHIGVGILAAIVVHLIHFRLEFSLAMFSGNLLPDTLKFGFSAIKQMTFNVFGVEQDAFYQTMAAITSNPTYWFTAGFFIFGLGALLYHFHFIKKKTMEEYDELFVFLLIGVLIHIILDIFFIETGVWI